jgi:hypothetical protein
VRHPQVTYLRALTSPRGGYRNVQLRDMKLETCLIYGPVTTGTTRQVTVRITWNTSGYPLNEAAFWYHLVDCTTGRAIAHQFYGTYDRDAKTGSRQTTFTIDSSHYYHTYATGDGSIQVGAPGTLGITSWFQGRGNHVLHDQQPARGTLEHGNRSAAVGSRMFVAERGARSNKGRT